MKFNNADNTPGDLYCRMISENGLIEIGICVVLYGYRVRAGFVGGYGYELDWCGGADQSAVEILFSMCKAILERREETEKCFDGVPANSEKKPYYLDEKFSNTIKALSNGFEYINLPALFSVRKMFWGDYEKIIINS